MMAGDGSAKQSRQSEGRRKKIRGGKGEAGGKLGRNELGRELGAKVGPKRKGGQEKIKGKVLDVRGFSCVCVPFLLPNILKKKKIFFSGVIKQETAGTCDESP